MRRIPNAALLTVALLAACSENDVLAPALSASKVASTVQLGFNADVPVRISEFHYDNVNGDVTEWIEISAPGGTNLQGYTIALYDGTNGTVYATRFLGSVVSTSCSGRGVVIHMVTNPPGIHNGPAGMALVRPDNSVVEFFSYEGTFAAVDGPAAGMTSHDIGVSETGNEPNSPVTSLKRNGATPFWTGPSQNNFGSCNDQTEAPPAASVEVTPASATFQVGANQQFTAIAYNASQQPIVNATIGWATSNASIATVSSSGVATGVAAGDVLIIASVDGKADTAQVHVNPPPVASVEVTPTSATFLVGATQQFTAVAFDASHQPIANTVISWSSTNSGVATVDASGLVTGMAAGNATIFATSPNGVTAAAAVQVLPNNSAPTAALDGPYVGLEGPTSINMSASGSNDPDAGDVLTYAWSFGDGSSGSGENVAHAYPQDGVYTVTLTVTDSKGLTSTASTTATISNVAPSINAFAGATLLPGETYSVNGSFTDPGADSWSATVNYGNGSGQLALPLSGKSFSLSRVYANPGVYTVTVRVTDDDESSSRTATVIVLSANAAIDNALAMLQKLVNDGKITLPNANPIREALEGARANPDQALNKLETALKHLDNAVVALKITAECSQPLRNEIVRIMQSIAPNSPITSQYVEPKPKKKG